MLGVLPLDVRMSAPMTAYYSPAARLARAQLERATAGWSWENDARRRMATIRFVLEAKGTVCHLCGQDGATTADHKTPRSQSGTHALDNLEPAHEACNLARQDTPLLEWFEAHPLRRPTLAPSREW